MTTNQIVGPRTAAIHARQQAEAAARRGDMAEARRWKQIEAAAVEAVALRVDDNMRRLA